MPPPPFLVENSITFPYFMCLEEDNGNYLESGQKTIELLREPGDLPAGNNDNNMDDTTTETESDVHTSKHTDI